MTGHRSNTGARALALATVAAMALSGAAAAQKPSALGAPAPAPQRPALPTAKPPPLGAPLQVQPGPQPAPPRFQQQPPPSFGQAPQPPRPAAPPAAPPPAARAPQAIPPNEPAAVTRLRGLLGPDTRLSYANAQALDGGGEHVRLTSVVLERPDKRATIEELTLRGLREDGVDEAVLTNLVTREARNEVRIAMLTLTGLTVPRGTGGPPQPDQVRLAGLRLAGLQVSGEANFRLAMATVNNWAPGEAGSLAAERIEGSGEGSGGVDAFRIARLGLSGVDLGGMLAAVIREEPAPSVPGRVMLELDGLELMGGGRPVGGVREVRLGANIADRTGSGTADIGIRGIRIEPAPMIADWMTRFGYQAIEVNVAGTSTYDAAQGLIEVNDLAVDGRDVGTLRLSLRMDGLTPERTQAADFSQARLIGAMLGYADASLFRRFLAMQSAQTRTPEPQLREQFAAMVGGMLSQPDAAALAPVRDAIQRFIRGQAQSVTIRVNPPQPIGVETMQQQAPDPASLQRVLGITAEAN